MLFIFVFCAPVAAQNRHSKNLIYTDAKGVMRFIKGGGEAQFFGVNYTVPFAYGYRSHKALGIDVEKAIDADVYHFSRLGFNAFRVHVWDTEITDSVGNLKNNEHLRLFDYLVAKLKERNIKMIVTPLAFWGNGYPEKDENTGSFSSIYNKQKVLVTEAAIKAQERYLTQFFKHKNQYTNKTYEEDEDVIATEINNEPQHSGPKEGAANYISRMVEAVKATGWSKPIFYNISESPAYADVVAAAPVDGVSFQWYPTGLVANRALRGNYLPNVDNYKIRFGDTIAAYKNKALMVYEFDAGDVLESYMYPAMARSFRTAGFQWATQFAYDPMATAFANTEYQTHYVNLAYTPSKAISLLIAGHAFRQLPRHKSWGTFPADTLFDAFRVSYKQQLSEMNTEEAFYYSNTTATVPKNGAALKHIAGVGSSPIVQYEGTGAYFLDKLADGVWRLEVMPDAIFIRDPFEKASLKKEVTRIQWQANRLKLNLPFFNSNVIIKAVNKGNDIQKETSISNEFFITPGVYLLSNSGTNAKNKNGLAPSPEFYAPLPTSTEPFVVHQPLNEVSSNQPFIISAKIVGVDTTDKVTVEIRTSANKWKTVELKRTSAYNYSAEVEASLVTPGAINYRFMVLKGGSLTYTFPGGFKGDPFAWDEYRNQTFETFVAPANNPIALFNAGYDKENVMLYNPNWQQNIVEYTAGNTPKQLVLKTTINGGNASGIMGWQNYFAEKIRGRKPETATFTKLVLKARSESNTNITVTLITADADAYAAPIALTKGWREIEVPLSHFKKDAFLLLPRPYPHFLPLFFKSASTKPLNIAEAEKVQVSFNGDKNGPASVEVEWIYLSK